MSSPKVPGWAVHALQEYMVKQGISAAEALRQPVVVPVNTIRGKRELLAGEKHPLSALMSRRTAYLIGVREDTKRMIVERSEAHRREMQVKAEEIDRVLAAQLKMMAQGVRPVLNEVGEAVKGKDGRQKVERLPPAVHVQVFNAATNWASRISPSAQKVEMEHSGKIELSDLESARAARIAREAELAALLASRTADE